MLRPHASIIAELQFNNLGQMGPIYIGLKSYITLDLFDLDKHGRRAYIKCAGR